MRISDWSSDVCSSDLTGRIVNRNAYQTMPHAKIFTSDVNMRFKFDTGPLSHQLLVGVDSSNYFERTRSAPDTSRRPGSLVTTIDIYEPVATGFAVLAYDLLPTKPNTHLDA